MIRNTLQHEMRKEIGSGIEDRDGFSVITVADMGQGAPKEAMPHIIDEDIYERAR